MEVRPGYKQTEIGVIPNDWRVACVGDAFDICNTLRLPISRSIRATMNGQYPYYGPTSIQGYINEYRVEGEYALIGEDGDHFLKWRNQSMTLLVSGKFNVNNHAHLIKGSRNETAWFYYFFAHRDLTPFLTRQGAGRFKLTKQAVSEIPCALPPLPEQRAIASALSDVDALLGALNRLIAKKRDLKQAAMQQLLTGQTRLPGLNGEWEYTTLGAITTFLSGGTPSRINKDFWAGEIPWISASSLRCFEIWRSDSNVTREAVAAGSKMAPVGSSLLLVRGSALHNEILCGLVTKPVCFNQDVKALVPHSRVAPRYLTLLIRGMSEALLKLVSSAGNTAGVLDTKLLKAVPIPLPDLAEQTAIAEVLSDRDAEIAALEQRREKTRALKQGMMQELLTGRTRLI